MAPFDSLYVKGIVLFWQHRIDEYMKNAIRDITLQRLKNEAEFCPDSEGNLDCLTEDELKFNEVLLSV